MRPVLARPLSQDEVQVTLTCPPCGWTFLDCQVSAPTKGTDPGTPKVTSPAEDLGPSACATLASLQRSWKRCSQGLAMVPALPFWSCGAAQSFGSLVYNA